MGKPGIKFTDVERLILVNQFSIRKAVEKTTDYDRLIEVLEKGYELFYSDVMLGVYDPMSEEASGLVMDVLDTYCVIEIYKRDHAEDTEVAAMPWASFHGFDGNNEGQELAFTHFLLKQGKFSEVGATEKNTDGFNSHMPTLDVYRRMVAKYRAVTASDRGNYQLSRDQIVAIISAASDR